MDEKKVPAGAAGREEPEQDCRIFHCGNLEVIITKNAVTVRERKEAGTEEEQQTVDRARGLTLRAARVNAGFRQVEVEENLGVSRSTLTRWESGRCTPRATSLRKLCELYGVKETDIVLKKR